MRVIYSMAMAIYPKQDQPWEFGIQQCTYARIWTKEEKSLFHEIGRRLADALSGLLTYRNLRENEAKLADAQRLAKIGNWEFDPVSGTLAWSDEIYRIFEVDPDTFDTTFETLLEAIHPDDREAVRSAYTDSLITKSPYEIEHRLLFSDGRIKYVYAQCETFLIQMAGPPVR
jgi:GAF domain-containing protein